MGIPEGVQDLVEEFAMWTYTDIAQEVRLRMLVRLNAEDLITPSSGHLAR